MEGVDGDEEEVVVLIYELNHLLHLSSYLGAQQASETRHAVVDVDDVVAILNLGELAQRHGELARAGAVALEGVLVEAVENLVVGEDTELCGVVDETLVEGAFHGFEAYVVATVGKNGAEALKLAVVVAEDEEPVALGHEGLE